MPDQRRKKNQSLLLSFIARNFWLVIILFIILVVVFYIRLTSIYFNGDDKLSLVINQNEKGVALLTFDPGLNEITNIIIPANTEIDLSQQLGTWKISSVWQLGYDEGLAGQLLSESITRHFKFPVFLWADYDAINFISNNPLSLVSTALKPFKTNLKLGDRLKLAFFAVSVNNSKKTTINLSDTSYLTKKELVEGVQGYVKTGDMPQRLAVIFSDPEISKKSLKLAIYDATGSVGLAKEVGELVEVMSIKVASIIKEDQNDRDCEIFGKDEKAVEKLAEILLCEESGGSTEQAFDINLKIGKGFANRF